MAEKRERFLAFEIHISDYNTISFYNFIFKIWFLNELQARGSARYDLDPQPATPLGFPRSHFPTQTGGPYHWIVAETYLLRYFCINVSLQCTLPARGDDAISHTRRCFFRADAVNELHVNVTATGSNVTVTPPSWAADSCDIRILRAPTSDQPASVSLRCAARGNPTPNFTWTGPLEPYSAREIAGLRVDSKDASLLHIENFTRSGELAVRCDATNTILEKLYNRSLTLRVSFEGFATFPISYLILILDEKLSLLFFADYYYIYFSLLDNPFLKQKLSAWRYFPSFLNLILYSYRNQSCKWNLFPLSIFRW